MDGITLQLDMTQAELMLRALQSEMSIYKELIKKEADGTSYIDLDMGKITDYTEKYNKMNGIVTTLAINGVQ